MQHQRSLRIAAAGFDGAVEISLPLDQDGAAQTTLISLWFGRLQQESRLDSGSAGRHDFALRIGHHQLRPGQAPGLPQHRLGQRKRRPLQRLADIRELRLNLHLRPPRRQPGIDAADQHQRHGHHPREGPQELIAKGPTHGEPAAENRKRSGLTTETQSHRKEGRSQSAASLLFSHSRLL